MATSCCRCLHHSCLRRSAHGFTTSPARPCSSSRCVRFRQALCARGHGTRTRTAPWPSNLPTTGHVQRTLNDQPHPHLPQRVAPLHTAAVRDGHIAGLGCRRSRMKSWTSTDLLTRSLSTSWTPLPPHFNQVKPFGRRGRGRWSADCLRPAVEESQVCCMWLL